MKEISLTRKQVLQLAKLAENFPDANWFTLEETSSSIGPVMKVKFIIFDENRDFDTVVDITDYDVW
jgi:hypothetical protein